MRQPSSFRKWIDLETKKQSFIEAAGNDDFPQKVFEYLSAAFDVPIRKLEGQGWKNTVLSLHKAYAQFLPKTIPLLDSAPKDTKPVDWDYDNRTWNYYSHLIAKAYGWTLDYIGNLDVNEALAHLQEILTDDQLEREFVYGLSEIAYPYNKSTKKSEFKPMKRPYWMKPVIKEVKMVKIRRDMLPVGRIQNIHGLPEEFKSIATEKINPTRN